MSEPPYMIAFPDEALRYRPSVSDGLGRKSVETGVVVDGTFIPTDTDQNHPPPKFPHETKLGQAR